LWAEIAAVEQAGNEAKGLRRNEDRVGLRERLRAGGEVGRLADRCLFLGGPHEIANNNGAHGTLGIVFVRCRIAEIDEYAIPHVLGDVAPCLLAEVLLKCCRTDDSFRTANRRMSAISAKRPRGRAVPKCTE
jgi:hypothetical protein